MKQKWQRPQLIVLGRGRPEENVLDNCKGGSGNQNGSTGQNSGCYNNSFGHCIRCAGPTTS